MKVLITGTSSGIGRAIALKFLNENHQVIGIDVLSSTINNNNYTHYKQSILDNLPEISGIEVLINNAGVQTESEEDIDINLKGTIRVSEKYAFQDKIKAVINIASSSGRTGSEFPHYAASKGGVITYTKNVALRLAKYGACCNSISPGGVITDLNKHILEDPKLWNQVLDESLLHKWANVDEIANYVYFLAVFNKSMTGQDLLIDNGEDLKANFIW